MDTFETLYRQHAAAILRFAWGLTGDRSEAQDIVSETFVRVLVKAPRIETATALAYLLAVARNVHLNSRRGRRRQVPLTDDLPAAGQDPDGRLDGCSRLDAVQKALRGLPEGERSALLLRIDHELSYEDVAAALGTTPGAAKVRVHRARLHLTEMMATRSSDQPGAKS